jgi:hypothetical protein
MGHKERALRHPFPCLGMFQGRRMFWPIGTGKTIHMTEIFRKPASVPRGRELAATYNLPLILSPLTSHLSPLTSHLFPPFFFPLEHRNRRGKHSKSSQIFCSEGGNRLGTNTCPRHTRRLPPARCRQQYDIWSASPAWDSRADQPPGQGNPRPLRRHYGGCMEMAA